MLNIVITGFMGSGKSVIGKGLSEKLSMEFLDTDDLIEAEELLPISEIFERFGEGYFREKERKIVKTLKDKKNAIISTGGKTLLFKKNFDLLSRNGVVITLMVDPEILWERLSNDNKRPLLKGITKEKFMKLYKKRKSEYEKLPNKINISNLDEKSSIEKIYKFITEKKENFEINVGGKISEVVFKRFLLKNFKDFIPENSGKIFLICDKKVFHSYSEYLKEITPRYYLIHGKDRGKNLKIVEKLWRWLLEEKIKRDSIILSLGGGVIGDICGFVSSTILRGVTHYHIPTTFLSMLDSSIGGKNGINFNSIKNAIGTFNPPDKVYIDPFFLFTLPKKEISSGLVEGIKAGLIGDPEILNLIENKLDLIKAGDLELIEEIMLRAINVKKRIVEQDPLDKNIRKILNLGHTLAHAIESYCGYRISHGEAVGIGLIYSIRISEAIGFCSSDFKKRIKYLLKKMQLKIKIEGNRNKIMELMKMDKKSTEKGTDFILLKRIGEPIIFRGVPQKIIYDSLKEVIYESSFN